MTTKTFYHICRKVPWSDMPPLTLGQIIETGQESNPFFKHYENFTATEPVTFENGKVEKVPVIHFLENVMNGNINCSELPRVAYYAAKHFAMYARELIWEDIRKTEFPHLPSRKHCLWLIPDLEGLRYWIDNLELKKGEFEYKIARVEAQGKFHSADESLLGHESEPYPQTALRARKYWSGEMSDSRKVEVLFEGSLKVVGFVGLSEINK